MHKVHDGLGMHSKVQSAIGSGVINHQRLSGSKVSWLLQMLGGQLKC